MNRPTGKLLALILIVTAVVLVTATGAFSSVTATRTANVDVADDANGVLSIEANGSTSSNGNYASTTGSPAQLQIDLTSSNLGTASGLNPNASTHIYHVFNVTNNDPNGNDKIVYITQEGAGNVDFVYNTTDGSGNGNLVGSANAVTLSSGERLSVGIIVDTQTLPSSYSEDFTIHAEEV